MSPRLLFDKIRLALLKRFSPVRKPAGKSYASWAAKGYCNTPQVTFVLQSHNKSLQILHTVETSS